MAEILSLYLKRCNCAIATSPTNKVQDLGDHNLVIPVIAHTYDEVNSMWRNVSGNLIEGNEHNLNQSFAQFFDYTAQPYCQVPNILYSRTFQFRESTPNGVYLRPLTLATPILANSSYSSGFYFLNYGGLGLRGNDGSTIDGFIYSITGSIYSFNASTYIGLHQMNNSTDTSLVGLGYYFITSDNRFCYVGAYYNKTNSIFVALSSSVTSTIKAWLEGLPDYEPETGDDPYDPGGTTGPGGGTGTFDGTGDDIDIPGLPTLSAADTGFITLFNPTLDQLKNLANYMWSDLFSLDTFKKLFADPMDAILGLSIVPVAVPDGGYRTVTVGNISTGVGMTVAASQYVEVDCGTLNVEEYWGAYLDYDPYTKCSIYLPYIGTHPIKTDDVMGKAVHVVYHVDILSGACTAFIKCGNSVLYQFIGQVASSIPITGDNFTNVINGVLNIAGSIGTMVATGGFTAPQAIQKAGLATAYREGRWLGAGAAGAQDVMSMKPQVEHSGGLSGTGGMLSVQVPYMILERPNQAIPAGQAGFIGYPSYMTAQLGSLSGYTEVESIHLENTPCTEKEADEILAFLEGGVII